MSRARRSPLSSPLAVAAVLVAGLGSLGCSSFERLDFILQAAPPDNAIVTFEHISMHEGVAVGVDVRPLEDDGEIMDRETVVELFSRDPRVLGVGPGFQLIDADDDPEDVPPNWSFVLFGAAPGETSVSVVIDGDTEADIPAFIEAQ